MSHQTTLQKPVNLKDHQQNQKTWTKNPSKKYIDKIHANQRKAQALRNNSNQRELLDSINISDQQLDSFMLSNQEQRYLPQNIRIIKPIGKNDVRSRQHILNREKYGLNCNKAQVMQQANQMNAKKYLTNDILNKNRSSVIRDQANQAV